MKPLKFQQALLVWYDQKGRTHLPWRSTINPYRVWISEIMLQQTQVTTVIPYFERFMQHFPTVKALAAAPQDEVLHLWTGLGYYSRARNLHKAAQIIVHDYKGKFPRSLAELENLPGIGRSTAGAILSIAMQQPTPILDGNVKRVLTRVCDISGWPGKTKVANKLWEIATAYTPTQRCDDYTQAIMDLGATLCTRAKPKCDSCPVKKGCSAFQQNKVNELPTPKPSKVLPVKATYFLIIANKKGEILLEKRPPIGIWGGLWGFPECTMDSDVVTWCQQRYRCTITDSYIAETFRHTFSHYHLDITPVYIRINKSIPQAMDANVQVWYNKQIPLSLGLAAPVKRLLNQEQPWPE